MNSRTTLNLIWWLISCRLDNGNDIARWQPGADLSFWSRLTIAFIVNGSGAKNINFSFRNKSKNSKKIIYIYYIIFKLGIEAVKTSSDERPNDDDVGFSSIIYKVSGIPSGIYLVRRTSSSSSLNIWSSNND